METVGALALVFAAYLVGAIPWGVVLGRTLKGIDPRQHGSGGTGATNSFRLLGAPIAIAVLLLDFLKGLLPVVRACAGDLPDWAIALCAILPVIGHCWSPYIGFKGGKGMATGGAAAVALLPWLGLLLLPMIVIVYFTRYVSAASLAATAVAALAVVLLTIAGDYSAWRMLAMLAVCAIIVYQHRTNITRLLNGTENKFGNRVAV